MGNRIAVLGVLALIAAGFAPPVHAQDDLRWFGHADEYGASLVYGLPETSFAPIAFRCSPERAELMFSFEFEPINPRDGVKVIVTLEAGGYSIPVETRGTRLEMDDLFILEGPIEADDRLAGLLASEGYLSVFVEDGSEDYPLDGAREAAGALLTACG